MASLRFIHAADLHLGSAPQVSSSDLPEEQADQIQEANFTAFKRIVDAARKQEVDFLLLAGDIYDREERSIAANRFFNEQCRRLKEVGIPVYVIAGNHDPLGERRELFAQPDNVVHFSCQEPETYQVPGNRGQLARIVGRSYANKYESNKVYSHFQPAAGSFNIGLLHTQLKRNDTKYIPASRQALSQQEGIDYWALGHIHQCRIEQESAPVIAYPGIPQGRDFGELGLGGCLLVEVDSEQAVTTEFIPTAPFVFLRPRVTIAQDDPPSNLEELTVLVEERAEKLAVTSPEIPFDLSPYRKDWAVDFEGYIVDWIIEGRGALHQTIQQQRTEAREELAARLRQKDLASTVWTESISFKTRAQVPDLTTLRQEDNKVFAELAEVIDFCRTEEDWAAELKNQLGSIWNQRIDHENKTPTKFQLTEAEYRDIVEQAKNLIIERILARRD